jgi:hypothetical protein
MLFISNFGSLVKFVKNKMSETDEFVEEALI